MKRLIRSAITTADCWLARASLSVGRQRPALLTLLFHSLFPDQREIDAAPMDPQQRITVAHFAAIIEYLQSRGYRFISPRDLLAGLKADRFYAMLTFDDGYFNNLQAVDVLDRLDVPATFFISTGHVRRGKSFWWDVLYRQRRAESADARAILAEGRALKSLRADEIEERLLSRFGTAAFDPRGPMDRPMSASELRELSRHPRVHLGNHTRDHAILTNYDSQSAYLQITGAQEDLAEMTGAAPVMIAYPNGDCSNQVVEAARRAGLRLGITVEPMKDRLPIDADDSRLMRLGRFTPRCDWDVASQCDRFRSDISLSKALRRSLKFAR